MNSITLFSNQFTLFFNAIQIIPLDVNDLILNILHLNPLISYYSFLLANPNASVWRLFGQTTRVFDQIFLKLYISGFEHFKLYIPTDALEI